MIDSNKLTKGDKIIINSNAASSVAEVRRVEDVKAELRLLDRPICVENNDYITMSIQKNNNIHLIGKAKIVDGLESIRV